LATKIIKEEDSFDAAVKRLNTTNVVCSVYFTVSGMKPNEGAVIEKDRKFTHGYYQLNET
jgi:hypothetical protein